MRLYQCGRSSDFMCIAHHQRHHCLRIMCPMHIILNNMCATFWRQDRLASVNARPELSWSPHVNRVARVAAAITLRSPWSGPAALPPLTGPVMSYGPNSPISHAIGPGIAPGPARSLLTGVWGKAPRPLHFIGTGSGRGVWSTADHRDASITYGLWRPVVRPVGQRLQYVHLVR